MKITRRISYETPEGSHKGTITYAALHIDTRSGKQKENLRLTIAVDPEPNDPIHSYRVRVDYWDKDDNLLSDMFQLLGPDLVHMTNEEGDIIPEKLSMLHGKRVQFLVTHDARPGFPIAYRRVKNLRPLDQGPNIKTVA